MHRTPATCRARDRRACRAARAPGCSRRAGTSRTRCSSALRRPGPIRRPSSSRPKRGVCRSSSSKLRRRVTLPLLFPCPCLQLRFDCFAADRSCRTRARRRNAPFACERRASLPSRDSFVTDISNGCAVRLRATPRRARLDRLQRPHEHGLLQPRVRSGARSVCSTSSASARHTCAKAADRASPSRST